MISYLFGPSLYKLKNILVCQRAAWRLLAISHQKRVGEHICFALILFFPVFLNEGEYLFDRVFCSNRIVIFFNDKLLKLSPVNLEYFLWVLIVYHWVHFWIDEKCGYFTVLYVAKLNWKGIIFKFLALFFCQL